MKIRSINYLAGEGVKNIWANRTMSIASVGVLTACMIVMGIAMILTSYADLAVKNLAAQNVVLVELDDLEYVDDAQVQAITTEIGAMDNVESVTLISSEEAFQMLQEELGDSYDATYAYLNEDPSFLPRVLQVSFESTQEPVFTQTLNQIITIDGVEGISSSKDVTAAINKYQKVISRGGFVIIVLLGIVSIVIVMNTIRITMSNRRREISIMKAVGATNGFIRMPFLMEGMAIGVIACAVSTILLYFIYTSAVSLLTPKNVIAFSDFAFNFMQIAALIGIGAGLVGSTVSITRYLRREGSSFSELS